VTGGREIMTIVSETALLATPFTVTTTFPVEAPIGTGTAMLVALQLVIDVAVVPLNVTALVPCVEPKVVPVIVTTLPIVADVGDTLVMPGVGNTVNDAELLVCPLTVTMTLPVVAPLGTGTTIVAALQLVGIAVVPLNVTVLVP
jgi:S-methylmethionine-dependent homocysteine/selenocysteine methylase